MSILLAKKLTSSNFTKWYHNLRIVLRYEKKMKFVEQLTRPVHDPKTADPDTIDKYYETVNLEQEEEGQSVSSYLLKMKSYLDISKSLGYAMPNEPGTIVELHAMLKLHEKSIPKKAGTPVVLTIREGTALTWWNGQIRTLGPEAYAKTWEGLKKKITDKYCPQGEIKKLEIELWNLKDKRGYGCS
ncbi:hypothetical protein Tco_0732549 [Tanacetum coccineum]